MILDTHGSAPQTMIDQADGLGINDRAVPDHTRKIDNRYVHDLNYFILIFSELF